MAPTSTIIPLFPLKLVLLPDETLPLHVFEPRYRALVRDCRKLDAPFGIILQHEGVMASVGCMAKIRRIARDYGDGRLDIVVAGERPFRLGRVIKDRPYLRAEVLPLDDRDAAPDEQLRERAITQHIRLLELAGRSQTPTVYQDRPRLSFFIGHNAGLSVSQQQDLLEKTSENERIRLLVEHMERFIPRLREAEDLRRKVSSNGHFPDFPKSEEA